LNAKYVGSVVLAEKRKYGKDGEYLAFVTGSLGNLSAGVYTFIEFIAGVQTTRALRELCSGAALAGSSFSACIATTWSHLSACSRLACGLVTFSTAFETPSL
jgi:hypothetical protein